MIGAPLRIKLRTPILLKSRSKYAFGSAGGLWLAGFLNRTTGRGNNSPWRERRWTDPKSLTPSLEARGGVRGSGLDLHDSNIEGIWSTIKRGIVGSFPKIGRKYMPLYIPEFQFRYNDYTITPDVSGTRGPASDAAINAPELLVDAIVARRADLQEGEGKAPVLHQLPWIWRERAPSPSPVRNHP